jgi:hypothetical protein
VYTPRSVRPIDTYHAVLLRVYILSHLIYTVRPCVIQTYNDIPITVPLPCHEYAFLKATSQGHGRVAAG